MQTEPEVSSTPEIPWKFRPDGYHDALLALFRDVVDDTDGLSQGKHAIYLREPICDALDVVPELPEA